MRSARSLLCIVSLVILTAIAAYGYGADSHLQITQKAFRTLAVSKAGDYDFYLTLRGQCPEIQDIRSRDSSFGRLRPTEMIIMEVPEVDNYLDVEFVTVKGGIGSGGRDDPHKKEFIAVNDEAATQHDGMSFTAFNHFIDIRKGPGDFDDYDGYSYRRGSASKNQYEKASEAARNLTEKVAAGFSRFKVDEGINWWYNDAYVHVFGQKWYDGCSPAMERYSFSRDGGRYPTREAELEARFPLAESRGESGRGVPYSVFMPLDNMARYWYGRFIETKDPLAMAPVLHAVQDASIPHHAAGCIGNWHGRYENDLDQKISAWSEELEFANGVGSLVAAWENERSPSPASLKPGDWTKTPSIDWQIDQLVTWVALNAYEAYRTSQGGFKDPYRLNESSAKRLATIATAMSVLVLQKAADDAKPASGGE